MGDSNQKLRHELVEEIELVALNLYSKLIFQAHQWRQILEEDDAKLLLLELLRIKVETLEEQFEPILRQLNLNE